MMDLKVVPAPRPVEEIAEEYLNWRALAKETEDKAKELRKELLAYTDEAYIAGLKTGAVTKQKAGPASVNYVGRFRALDPAQAAVLRDKLGEHYDDAVDATEQVTLRGGVTLDVLEAIIGETKMARIAPLLEVKKTTKLTRSAYNMVASLFVGGSTEEAEALLDVARATAYEPHVRKA